jgi:hypothetical protein
MAPAAGTAAVEVSDTAKGAGIGAGLLAGLGRAAALCWRNKS